MENRTTNFNESYVMAFNKTHAFYCLIITGLIVYSGYSWYDKEQMKTSFNSMSTTVSTKIAKLEAEAAIKRDGIQRIRANNTKNTESIEKIVKSFSDLTEVVKDYQSDTHRKIANLNDNLQQSQLIMKQAVEVKHEEVEPIKEWKKDK